MISLAPERPVATVEAFIDRAAGLKDQDADRAVYRLTGMAVEERPLSLRPLYTCWSDGEQRVWGDESELVLVRQWVKVTTAYFPTSSPLVIEVWCQQLEVWTSYSGYHARLDDLAGVDDLELVA